MAEAYEQALVGLRSMLEADGYLLEMDPPSGPEAALTLRVIAGTDACEECLVPIELFKQIVAQHLADSAFQDDVTVVYPTGESLPTASSAP